jgi:hypothetical protein
MDTTKSLLSSVPPKAGYGVTFTFTEECVECFSRKKKELDSVFGSRILEI